MHNDAAYQDGHGMTGIKFHWTMAAMANQMCEENMRLPLPELRPVPKYLTFKVTTTVLVTLQPLYYLYRPPPYYYLYVPV